MGRPLGAARLALQTTACGLWLWHGRASLSRKSLTILAAFAAVGLAPYLFLGWNCYEYCTSLAVVAYALLLGLTARNTRTTWRAALLLLIAAEVSTLGNHFLGCPAVVARAHWAQRQLDHVRPQREAHPASLAGPIYVVAADENKFASFGVPGLAYTLGLRLEDVRLLDTGEAPPGGGLALVVPPKGDVYFLHCQPPGP